MAKQHLLRRVGFGLQALSLAAASTLPVLLPQSANAAGQVQSRSIEMSDSKVSATSVTYKVKFTAATTATIKSLVVDFCSNSPIIGDACTAPTGFTVGTPTVTVVSGITGWTGPTSASSGRTLKISNATGNALTAGSSVVEFDLTTATNTSTLGSFYGRILTYPNDSGANSAATYAAASEGSYTDYGGIALATANKIDITAKVQETLNFCVYATTSGGTTCGGATAFTGVTTAVTLGDSNGVLQDTTQTYTSTSGFGLGSNALNGVYVRMKGATLTSGTNTIDPYGASCTANSAATTVEQFGMRVSTAGAGQTAIAPYNCAASNHGLDITTACGGANDGNITCLYGQKIASTTTASDETQSTIEWAAKAANASAAGIYTTTMTFIATGSY